MVKLGLIGITNDSIDDVEIQNAVECTSISKARRRPVKNNMFVLQSESIDKIKVY